jgi:aspartate/methionine/tyrosine aminotransferase
LTFVLSGLSKVAALPQMKLSWIWSGGPEGSRREARRRIEHVSDLFLSVGTAVQIGAARLLELASPIREAVKARIASNVDFLEKSVPRSSPIDLLPAEGGWYAVLRLPALRTSEEWALELASSEGVVVHPGYLFDFPSEAYLVVSLLSPPTRFRAGVERMVRRVEIVLNEQEE